MTISNKTAYVTDARTAAGINLLNSSLHKKSPSIFSALAVRFLGVPQFGFKTVETPNGFAIQMKDRLSGEMTCLGAFRWL